LNGSSHPAAEKIPVLVLFAPTASGKTALSLSLFGQGSPYFFKGRGEIISADSMQVYRKMNVGTAKPDTFLCSQLPHHLIDICDPDEQFSAAAFVEQADRWCADIWSRGKLPVVAGGTGFYVRCFLLGLPQTPPSDPALRDKLRRRVDSGEAETLYRELMTHDPVSADRIHQNDVYRIIRALEVFYLTGRPLSSFELSSELRSGYRFCILVLGRSRTELYRRIDNRTEEMFRSGLVSEYNALVRAGYTASDPGMQAIGYRELAEAFPFGLEHPENHEKELGAVREKIKRASRRYAKKQYTFMKDIPGAVFCPLNEGETASATVIGNITDFCSSLHLT